MLHFILLYYCQLNVSDKLFLDSLLTSQLKVCQRKPGRTGKMLEEGGSADLLHSYICSGMHLN